MKNMDLTNAATMIKEYGEALLEGETARSISLLPYPKSIIKYAFFVCIEGTFPDLDEEQIQALIEAFSQLDHFIEDKKAKFINEIIENVNNNQLDLSLEENKQKKILYDDFMKVLNSTKNKNEITEYIAFIAKINNPD